MQQSGKEEVVCMYCGLPGKKEYCRYFYQNKDGSLQAIREYHCPRCDKQFVIEEKKND